MDMKHTYSTRRKALALSACYSALMISGSLSDFHQSWVWTVTPLEAMRAPSCP